MDNPLTLGYPQTSLHGSRSLADFFFDVIRPPEPFQFVGDVIPILHGEPRKQRRPSELARRRLSRVRVRRSQRTFAHHHNGHGDAVIGAIDICVPKSVEEIELLTTFPQVAVFADLRRTLHVQDTSLSFIVFYQLSKYLLTIAFPRSSS